VNSELFHDTDVLITSFQAPIGTKIEIFKYNQTFSLEPSDISNAAWEDLIPRE
jgi:hypothetical protein